MAFRSLSFGTKVIVGAVGSAGAATILYKAGYQYNSDMYRTMARIPDVTGTDYFGAEKLFQQLKNTESNSLLKKHLTEDIFNKLKDRKTKNGVTLMHLIQSGAKCPDASIGVYAPDVESYKMFRELLDPIIEEYHQLGPKDKQPPVDYGESKMDYFKPLDKDGNYILSTRIRCGRSLLDYPMTSRMTSDDFLVIERNMMRTFSAFSDQELRGKYYPLFGMSKGVQQQLIKDHFLFKDNDRHLEACGAFRFWPKGRGIFHNDSKTFLVWVGEEDHLRLISMEQGGDVGQVFTRLVKGLKEMEKFVKFSRDDRLGWYTHCPTNLGSTIRASVHIKLPNVSSRKDFKEICDELNLQARGVHGEHSAAEGGVYDISNKRRLGLSEFQAVKDMYDGVKALIEMEQNGGRRKA